MQKETERRTCTAVIGSMTQAMRARRALTNAAVYANVVKVNAATAKHGCAYGVSYPCSLDGAVREVLRREGIRAQWGGGMG